MGEDATAEKVRNALAEARTASYTVFTAALLIAAVAVLNLADRQSTYERLQEDAAALRNIATRAEHTIREIRRYLLWRLPGGESDGRKTQEILAAVAEARRLADRTSEVLLTDPSVTLDRLVSINTHLDTLRSAVTAIPSPWLDYAPQSVVVAERLEALRLRDLAVLARLAAADPLGTRDALRAFDAAAAALPAAAAALDDTLRRLAGAAAERDLSQLVVEGDRLREAVEARSRARGSLAVGALESSFEETLKETRRVETRLRTLTDELTGDFDVKVPYLDRSLPARTVVGLFPVGLVAGFGLVLIPMVHARKQLAAIGWRERAAVADAGTVFTQLRKADAMEWAPAWIVLVALLVLPNAAGAYLVAAYARTLEGVGAGILYLLVAAAVATAFLVLCYAWRISGIAKG